MSIHPDKTRLRVDDSAGLLAVIPHLLGFTPDNSLVVVGVAPPAGRVHVAFRYDLPDPPDADLAADIAAHALGVLDRHHIPGAAVIGYGPGRLVTPVADAIRSAAADARLVLREMLRVEDGRYWSYLCDDPACCPADGVPFDPAAHPAGQAMARAGLPALADRSAVAATIAPVTGPLATTMRKATRRAERTAVRLIASGGPRALDRPGLAAVQEAISIYRDGGSLSPDARHAWLALVLQHLPVRDDAWARMDPGHRDAHRRLWADVVRRAQPGYVAPPASLLAFTAWQAGDGALANIAIDRALADDPGYSMALLLRGAITGGLPPSMAVLPMTPDEVAASYADHADPANSDHSEPSGPPPRPCAASWTAPRAWRPWHRYGPRSPAPIPPAATRTRSGRCCHQPTGISTSTTPSGEPCSGCFARPS